MEGRSSLVSSTQETMNKSRCCCCSKKTCCITWSVCSLVVACVCVAFAVLGLVRGPIQLASFASEQIKEKVTIVPGHSSYDQLKNPSLPIYMDVYFFNLTNFDSYAQGTEPPHVHEVGPYSFREIRDKYYDDSSFSHDRSRLNYTQLKTFHFDPSTSGKGLAKDDTICTINLALVGAVAEIMAIKERIERDVAIEILKGIFSKTDSKLHICQPASALVFNYTDPLVHELHTNWKLKLAKRNLPNDYVSIQLNASLMDSYPSIIDTGVQDINKLGQFYQWDGQKKLSIWFDDYANTIRGTEGIMFKPNLVEGEGLEVFVDNTYRSFPLIYTGKKQIKGLQTFKYELPMSVFQSAFSNRSNSRWGSWCPDGMFYIGVTQKPAVPAFASKPRFLDVDPRETSEKVHVLPPDREKHDTFLYVHPLIGSTLQFTRSLQINLQVNYTTAFKQLEHINGTTYFPVFYITEHSELTDSFKSYIMKQGLEELEIAKYVMYSITGVLFLIALIAIIGSLGCLIKGKRSNTFTIRSGYTRINDNAD